MVQSRPMRLKPKMSLLLRLSLVLLSAVFVLGSSGMPPGDRLERIRAFTRQIEFDFVNWSLNALRIKFIEGTLGLENFLSAQQRRQAVLEYLDLVREIQRYENAIEEIYSDPAVIDPLAESSPLRTSLEALYVRRDQLAPLAEAILQSQISTVVAQMGLSLGGQATPPVLYHSSPLPLILITSPREVIRLDQSIVLNSDLTVAEKVKLEENIDRALNISSLVERIGGLGLYPTMVIVSSDLNWLSEVVAHEWVHNYLTLRPLGLYYLDNPEMRVINETVASIAGIEIGEVVIKQFYPELVPPPPATPAPETEPLQPPAFEFRKEMYLTRQNADRLLAEGKIEEAEHYMETRRQIFWENGYHSLRKLNQAYFAFHGAYADQPGGAAGAIEDPVGESVRALRAQSASLAHFLNRVSWVTSFEQLQGLLAKEVK